MTPVQAYDTADFLEKIAIDIRKLAYLAKLKKCKLDKVCFKDEYHCLINFDNISNRIETLHIK